MKQLVIVCSFLLLGCSTTKLTKTESENLQIELAEMHRIDQIAALANPNGEFINYPIEKWTAFTDSVFKKNKNRIESLYNQYGYLGINELGKTGSNDFWLIVQHSDKFPEFQQKILIGMKKAVKKRNANPRNYAYLADRVKANNGEKQLFGTQVDYRSNGQAKPKNGLIDSLTVDKRRKEYNLEDLKTYLNEMTEMHYEMNKGYFNTKGITKPNLYQ